MHPLSDWSHKYREINGRAKMSEDDFAVEPIEGLPEQTFTKRRSDTLAGKTELVATYN